MAIITLTTDLGFRDHYLAIVKAALLSANSSLHVIDISAGVKGGNISEAAFLLGNSLAHFPDKTVHLVGIKFVANRSGLGRESGADNSRYLVAEYRNQFIITPDNGLFTLLDTQFSADVYQLYYEGEDKHHFFLKDLFVDAALHLAAGKSISEIGVKTDDFFKSFPFEPFVNGNMLRGKAIYTDDFGNIITNITREKFLETIGSRTFTVTLPGARLNRICVTYDEVRYGSPLLIFNSSGYLEVAVNGKSAYEMLCPRDIGSNFDFNLIIEFND